jgi:hypothetical protein
VEAAMNKFMQDLVEAAKPWPPPDWVTAPLHELLEPEDWPKLRKRKRRKPSIRRMVAAAEKTGKIVTGITMPDGTVLHFGELAPTEASNPWLDDLKVTKQ